MMELAEEALSTHDATDARFDDEYHTFFEDLEHSKTTHRTSALRLARLVMDGIEELERADSEVAVAPRRAAKNLN